MINHCYRDCLVKLIKKANFSILWAVDALLGSILQFHDDAHGTLLAWRKVIYRCNIARLRIRTWFIYADERMISCLTLLASHKGQYRLVDYLIRLVRHTLVLQIGRRECLEDGAVFIRLHPHRHLLLVVHRCHHLEGMLRHHHRIVGYTIYHHVMGCASTFCITFSIFPLSWVISGSSTFFLVFYRLSCHHWWLLPVIIDGARLAQEGEFERVVSWMRINRLTVNSQKMHTTPHSHIIISIYIFKYNKVRRRGRMQKTAVNC